MIYSVKRKALVPYTPAQMYQLVNQVEAYSQFVPWCTKGYIIKSTNTEMIAGLEFSGKGLHKTFTTRNTLDKNRSIELALVDGPFKKLEGVWTFTPLSEEEGGCEVGLSLDFELSNAWLSHLFGQFFTEVANRLVDVFCKRADEVYGRSQQ